MPSTPFNFAILDERGTATQSFAAGEKIFMQDEAADRMYVVRSGKVQIITFGTVLENVGPGGVFGEMAMVDGAPRSAAALAAEPTDVMAVDRETFLFLIQKDPEFALRIMQVLANRIRRMNSSL
jgi:CRP/FNR family transcriptional regulator, cyclic AMP receptor protein